MNYFCMTKYFQLKKYFDEDNSILKSTKRVGDIMKYTFILSFFFSVCTLANTYAQQNVTLNIEGSIEDAIEEIQAKTNFTFVYNIKDIDVNQHVSLNVTNKSLFSVLDKLFYKNDIAFKTVDNHIVLFKTNSQQAEKTVKGVITDGQGLPIIGANVVQRGTTNGTITDLDGLFSISIPDDAEIEISYIGYIPQTFSVKGKTEFSVVLKENTQTLDEVVVIGYGVQKKKLITGATVQIKGDDIQKLSTTSAMGALQSQTPGVNITKSSGEPGASYKVTVRGLGTVGNSSPLYIVDGVNVGDIDYLNPTDIASIDVLKDAASAAIYGARAANGVILITTKKGHSGKASVEYNGYFGVQNFNQNVTPLNAQQFKMIMDEAAINSKMEPFNYSELVPDWDKIENGSWKGTNWLDEMVNKNALTQNHSLSVRGGTDQSTYSLGLSYTDQDGIFGAPKAPNYKRYTVLVNTEHKVIKAKNYDLLTFGENLSYSNIQKNVIGTGNLYGNDLRSALCTSPFLPVYDEKGDYHHAIDWDDKQANPIAILTYKNSNNITRTNKLSGNFFMVIQPLKGLKYRSSFGLNYNASSYRSFVPEYDLSSNDLVTENKTTQNSSQYIKWIFENTLSYDFKLNDNHQFSAIIGSSLEKSNIGENVAGNNYNSIFSDFKHAYLSNNKIIYEGKTVLSGNPGIPNRLTSYFGRLNYNYNETYMATLVMRTDASSIFAPNHRWGYFPSASAGWVITNEEFMKNTSSWLDFLKIRGSWGQNGNQNIAAFQYLSSISFDSKYYFGTDKTTSTTGAYPSILANEDVKWETSEQIDLGIDARLFNGRLAVNLDFYTLVSR